MRFVCVAALAACGGDKREPPPVANEPRSQPTERSIAADARPSVADVDPKERDRVVAELRRIVGPALAGKVSTSGTALMLDAGLDDCSGRKLIAFRDALLANRVDASRSFERMNCGEMGDEIDLRSPDGCVPGVTGQVILTDAGAQRDKMIATIELGESVAGYIIVAGGCDATSIDISLSAEATVARCSRDKIETMKRKRQRDLVRVGFKRIRCAPDGPAVDL